MLILVRITAFVYAAPFFSLRDVPQKVKVGFSLFFTLILFQIVPGQVQYDGIIGFAALIISELMVGLIIGFFANISFYILTFAGSIMDMEIGFSMVNQFDPVSNIQTTITSNYYMYIVMLIMLVTNLHHYLIMAVADTFKLIPLGAAKIRPDLYLLMLRFIKDYFIIGFRIVLPIFAGMLIVNSILAILAKIAPQLNMFVIGLQLKVLIGLFILFLMVGLTPTVSGFIFDEMISMIKSAIKALT
ncbi:flagellar biosynthetic protein FliR [Anaerocolumna sp. AGMB13025]|uniref:flagellar biosynthetic protein FliR n=1 Tax=Anaerocolumna sp. AGMB13025 TaxID=3039116 RepID=UPI00241C4D16|nr:flagellar biosynthetic protein FliR [Anaerocolumna sp. AGMB13025]WFR54963.1 flagellar biosynthetic protein FliR [Anaerocolumna sp. AGMB13025]